MQKKRNRIKKKILYDNNQDIQKITSMDSDLANRKGMDKNGNSVNLIIGNK